MKPKISDLWRWTGTLDRGTFFFWGVLLAAIKFNIDRVITYAWFDQFWTIFDWSMLRMYLWQSPLQQGQWPYFLTLLAASLPFLWMGTVLILRRLRSIGWRPFWILLFFVPVVKLIFRGAVFGAITRRGANASCIPQQKPTGRAAGRDSKRDSRDHRDGDTDGIDDVGWDCFFPRLRLVDFCGGAVLHGISFGADSQLAPGAQCGGLHGGGESHGRGRGRGAVALCV